MPKENVEFQKIRESTRELLPIDRDKSFDYVAGIIIQVLADTNFKQFMTKRSANRLAHIILNYYRLTTPASAFFLRPHISIRTNEIAWMIRNHQTRPLVMQFLNDELSWNQLLREVDSQRGLGEMGGLHGIQN
jgi:hypothetical protein